MQALFRNLEEEYHKPSLYNLSGLNVPHLEGSGLPARVSAGLKRYRAFIKKKKAEGYTPAQAKVLWKSHKKGGKTTRTRKRGKGISGGHGENLGMLKMMEKLLL